MNRRGFLKLLGVAGAAVATGVATLDTFLEDPERALWVPGQKRIVDLGARRLELRTVEIETGPSYESWSEQDLRIWQGGRRAGRRHQLVSVEMVSREALRVLKNNLAFVAQVNREYDGKFGGAVIGGSVNARIPARSR